MNEVVITSAARTAVGRYGGSLKDVAPTELGAIAVEDGAASAPGSSPTQVEQVVFGNVIHSAPEDMYMARVVAMKAGIPKEVPAFTVNRLCGTGVQAIVSAAQTIATGEADVAVAGGAESMSRGPYWMPDARWGARMGDTEWSTRSWAASPTPSTTSTWASPRRTSPSRTTSAARQQDEFSVESHRRAASAQEEGLFDDEIVPVELKSKKGTSEFAHDEHVRPDASVEGLAKLKPVFKQDGTVTAGNASA